MRIPLGAILVAAFAIVLIIQYWPQAAAFMSSTFSSLPFQDSYNLKSTADTLLYNSSQYVVALVAASLIYLAIVVFWLKTGY